jgi:hypothetical protein
MTPEEALLKNYNHSRYRTDRADGFYESYFQRANHPERPLAFWIRYTLFAPAGRPQDAIGELWAVYTDGERGRVTVAKSEIPLADCRFSPDAFDVRIGTAVLADAMLRGTAENRSHRIDWDLSWQGGQPPVLLLPPELYDKAFPKAKSLVGVPMAVYSGRLHVDGVEVPIGNWIGSQNHNWGIRHTDHYAYGQVCGFDNAPDSFLEVATGRIRMGPVWTPFMTPMVLRHEGEEYALRGLGHTLFRTRARFGYFHWHFRSTSRAVRIDGEIHAPRESFAGLRYYNPPGGEKHCLNSKIAYCRLSVKRRGRPAEILESRHRAAFEILTDDPDHGVEIRT